MSDATCYESYIKYPTDVELLWDCILWLKGSITNICHHLKIPVPRTKFNQQKKRHLAYMRRRRKFKKETRKRCKQSLYLCYKMIGQLKSLLIDVAFSVKENEQLLNPTFSETFSERFQLIQKIYKQQEEHYENPSQPIPDRIVSLYKSYIRPIVRGKTNKRVEFGAKVNTWQVGSLNFIEHFSFDAFHRLKRRESD